MAAKKQKQSHNWRPFQEARAFVRGLGLKNFAEWRALAKTDDRPQDIPSSPASAYKKEGWVSWGDWLGTGVIASFNKTYRSFYEARAFVRNLGFKNQVEWNCWRKTPDRPEANPSRSYQGKGWVSWGDWFGTGNRKGGYRTFEDARAFARSLGLKGQNEWKQWVKSGIKPTDIPANPVEVYGSKGWVSFGDWLGTGNIWVGRRAYRSFDEAQKFVRSLKLTSRAEWSEWYVQRSRMGRVGRLARN
jgi:hypothetical protein